MPKVRNLVFSRPYRSETEPHKILDRAYRSMSGSRSAEQSLNPKPLALLTWSHWQSGRDFAVAISPPAHGKEKHRVEQIELGSSPAFDSTVRFTFDCATALCTCFARSIPPWQEPNRQADGAASKQRRSAIDALGNSPDGHRLGPAHAVYCAGNRHDGESSSASESGSSEPNSQSSSVREPLHRIGDAGNINDACAGSSNDAVIDVQVERRLGDGSAQHPSKRDDRSRRTVISFRMPNLSTKYPATGMGHVSNRMKAENMAAIFA